MRLIGILCVLVVIAFAQAGWCADQDSQLKHPWKEEYRGGEITLISPYPAPFPFSTTDEPEATIAINTEPLSQESKSLPQIVKGEVDQIRKGLQIAEYLEEDGNKPEKGIAIYFKDIGGKEVAFIKYRTIGVIGQPAVMPRNVTHAIFIKDNRAYFVHLIVLFAGHEEEVRADQMRIVRDLIEADSKAQPRH